ncbi:MAG: hypothetical protein QW230_02185 [Thermofilum sp.]
MVTTKELEKLLEWTRRKGARVEISFKETAYKLRVNTMYRAVDPSGDVVPWTRAFGTKAPVDVLNSLSVKRILVNVRGKEEEYRSLNDLLRAIGP